jgi:hypothetical protein
MPYLNKNITGAASRVEYGKKGDKVEVVPFEGFNEMVLVKGAGKPFWVWPEDLSDKPIDNERRETVESVLRVHKAKGRRR